MGVKLLGKIKLYELAKEMNVSSKDLLEKAKKMGIELKSNLSVVSYEDVKKIFEKTTETVQKVLNLWDTCEVVA